MNNGTCGIVPTDNCQIGKVSPVILEVAEKTRYSPFNDSALSGLLAHGVENLTRHEVCRHEVTLVNMEPMCALGRCYGIVENRVETEGYTGNLNLHQGLMGELHVTVGHDGLLKLYLLPPQGEYDIGAMVP